MFILFCGCGLLLRENYGRFFGLCQLLFCFYKYPRDEKKSSIAKGDCEVSSSLHFRASLKPASLALEVVGQWLGSDEGCFSHERKLADFQKRARRIFVF
jgi:hypothetical protein